MCCFNMLGAWLSNQQIFEQQRHLSEQQLRVYVLQERGISMRTNAATLDAPTTSSPSSTLPTEAARRTAFREDFTPELVYNLPMMIRPDAYPCGVQQTAAIECFHMSGEG